MTPDASHRELRLLTGAYLLGGLDNTDRARFDDHLEECADCRREVARLAPVPGLLGRLRDRGLPARTEPPSADLLARILDRSQRERRRGQRRTVVTTFLVAVAFFGAVLAATAIAARPDRPVTTTIALQPTSGYRCEGSAALTAKGWGTAVALDLRQMPANGPFRLEVTGQDGTRQVAATWAATSTGRAVISGASALPLADIAAISIIGPDGPVLEGSAN